MTILAIDPGTKCGYAFGAAPDNMISGVWDLSSRRHEGGGMRYLRLRKFLDDIGDTMPLDQVAYEEVRAHRGVDAAHVYGGIIAVIGAWCEERKVPFAGVPVQAIKKHATGKGNSNKEAMIAAAVKAGYSPVDDNEADAIWLFLQRYEEMG